MRKRKTIVSIILAGMILISLSLTPAIASTGKININTATKAELVTLKFVGDKIAQKIIEHRKATPFEKPKDIMKIKGVGQKVFDSNKMRIVVKK